MKKQIAVYLLVALTLSACSGSARQANNKGNEAFDRQDYGTALEAYRNAQAGLPDLAEPVYNEANVHYRQEDYASSQQRMEQALHQAKGNLAERSFYNLGNTLFQTGQFGDAVEAYKEALRLNPDDANAKHNLELALRRLQEQQQKQEQQEQQKEEDNKRNRRQEQSTPTPSPGTGQGQPTSTPSPENEQAQPQAGQEHQKQQPADSSQTAEGLTEEQARKLLEAASQGTQSLQQYLQQVYVAPGPPSDKDW